MVEHKEKEMRYSGPKSVKFWTRVNSIKPESKRSLIYIAACALQDHEGRVFQMLRELKPEDYE